MLKTLLAEVKQYKKASILTPAFMVGEVVMEILIPMLMAHLIDSGVEQGDVVVAVNVLDEPIIKRVIATEGQTVDFDYEAGAVLVDGQPVDETQFGLENGITEEPYSSFELLEFPQTVPEGCVFVLGDNRAVSEDSRYLDVGMIDTRNILGKAVFHLLPLKSLGPVK